MKHLLTGIAVTGLLLASAQAFSNDMQKDSMGHKEMMKKCMTRMQAKNDGSTHAQMKAACGAEMKGGMDKEDGAMKPSDATPEK